MIPTIVLAVCLLYVLWDRSRERQQVTKDHEAERKLWASERNMLLTRIQAPQTITPEIPEDAPTPEAINPVDDDEGYWAARGFAVDGTPLSQNGNS